VRLLKFGIATDSSKPVDEVVRSVQEAERLGFDSAWIADLSLQRDAYVVLTACALKTRTIRLGIAVTNPYTRHPAVTAAAFATLNEIAEGRTAIGIGVGSKQNLLQPLGIKRHRPNETLKEAVKIIRELLSSTTTHAAKVNFVTSLIPIYVAGRGRETLTVAGEMADGAMVSSLTTPRALSYAFEAIDRGAKSAGRNPESIQKIIYTRLCITKNEKEAKEQVRPLIAYRIWDDSFSTLQQLGYDRTTTQKIKNAYAQKDFETAKMLATDQMIDDFAIAGTVDACLEKIERLKKLGVNQIVVTPVSTNRGEQLKQFVHSIVAKIG